MLELAESLPWHVSTTRWPLDLQVVNTSILEKAQRRVSRICDKQDDEDSPNRFGPCRLGARIQLVPTSDHSMLNRPLLTEDSNDTIEFLLATFAGDIAFALGDIDDATTIWREHVPDYDLIWRIDRVAIAGRYELAEEFVVDLDYRRESLSSGQPYQLATLLARLATFYSTNGEYVLAARYWQLAIDTVPKANFYHGLGVSLAKEQRWHEAVVALETAVALEPGDLEHLLTLATIYRTVGRDNEAFNAARAALELAPTNERVLRFLQEIE